MRRRAVAASIGLVSLAVALWVAGRAFLPPSPAARLPNIVLVTIDTLRADRVGVGLTPAIDRLAASGVTFTAARATAPLTFPSHASLLTGTRPSVHGARENGVPSLAAGVSTLAESLAGAGYRTGAFVSAYVLDRRFGLGRGFDVYDDAVRRRPDQPARLEAERPGAETVAAALAWLDSGHATGAAPPAQARPFFLWVHLYEPHAPYTPGAAFLARAGGDPYGGEVAAADAEVDRLLRVIDADFAAGRTIVALSADHGESLGDHGEATHGMLLYDAAIRVPLVIAAPTRWGPGRRDGPVSLVDVAPTLLALAGVAVPDTMTGMDLRLEGAAREVYSETEYPRTAGWSPLAALVDDRWKLVVSSETELFDLATDSGEATNLASARQATVQAMRARLDLLRRPAAGAEAGVVSPEAVERLRALGYVGSAPRGAAPARGGPNPAGRIALWNRFETALTDLAAGRASAAAARIEALVTEDPDAPVFRTTLARAWLDAGDPRRALAAYRDAARRWPTDPVLLHDLAVAAREAGALEEAGQAELAAIALEANHPAAFNGLGLIRVDQARWAEAADAFSRAVELDATNASYWVNLGNVRRERRDVAGAETAYRTAIDLDSSYADASNGLGVLLVQAGRPAEAATWFERALANAPDFYEARLNLAIAYEASGQVAKAIATLRPLLDAPAGFARERQAAAALLKRLAGRR